LVLVVILGYAYFGGPKVPKILKDYKEMLLGVFVGILLHQFFGVRVEGVVGDEPVIQENDPLMSLEDYCPSSEYRDGPCPVWQASRIQDLVTQYNNFISRLDEEHQRVDGDEDRVKDPSIFFTAEGSGTFEDGGKKYTCDPDYQMVYANIPQAGSEGITAQMCLKENDPENSKGVIRIRDTNHDSLNEDPKNLHLHNKKVVICGASSGAPMQVSESGEGGEISFYCPQGN